MVDFRFYLVSDRGACGGRSLAEALLKACRAGVRAVQIREKDLDSSSLLALTRNVQRKLAEYRPVLLVNGDLDVARTCSLQGVHLPEGSVSVREMRDCLPPGVLIARSTHGLEGARKAEDEGADFITYGPVFPTPSKAAYGPPRGLPALAETTRAVTIPVYALGGVTPGRAAACLEAGAHGVAAISAVLSRPDIPLAVRQFERALGRL